jgi:methionine-rich copper-binding protein CopC
MKRSTCLLVLAVLVGGLALLGRAAPAGAHGELEGADPKPNAHLKSAPSDVTMTFTEEPSEDSVLTVSDGCGNDVVQRASVSGHDYVVEVATGQPGKWHAKFRVISAEDGHLTKGTYSFEVAGKKDCSPDKGGDGEDGSLTTAGPGDGGPTNASGNDVDEGSDFPVVPVVIGAVALIVVGVVIRRASAG